jgi:hypothetical protein
MYRVVLIVDGRSRAGEIVDLINLDVERKRYVVAHNFEFGVVQELVHILSRSGEKIIYAKYFTAPLKQNGAEM